MYSTSRALLSLPSGWRRALAPHTHRLLGFSPPPPRHLATSPPRRLRFTPLGLIALEFFRRPGRSRPLDVAPRDRGGGRTLGRRSRWRWSRPAAARVPARPKCTLRQLAAQVTPSRVAHCSHRGPPRQCEKNFNPYEFMLHRLTRRRRPCNLDDFIKAKSS